MNASAPFAPNQCCPHPGLLCGGQPSAGQLAAFARAGGRCVINLRPQAELGDWDEDAVVRALGLAYVHIPIDGAAALCREAARRLADALARHGAGPVLVHCGSGNRVGALVALKAAWVDGHAPAQALAAGRQAGLTGLEPAVRALLASAR
ncbi:MAG: sulfur transferase domain-containing protein [Mizugakiibacter sp.]|uniref:beta-lactamase hydrolase domain-containing protein n=1 Tax=Mizugakiibacter sp. TaxID=1972610 RepID=UPI0031C72B8D|nr:hypothetical protein [Xanthomonadaceae bacterium]